MFKGNEAQWDPALVYPPTCSKPENTVLGGMQTESQHAHYGVTRQLEAHAATQKVRTVTETAGAKG